MDLPQAEKLPLHIEPDLSSSPPQGQSYPHRQLDFARVGVMLPESLMSWPFHDHHFSELGCINRRYLIQQLIDISLACKFVTVSLLPFFSPEIFQAPIILPSFSGLASSVSSSGGRQPLLGCVPSGLMRCRGVHSHYIFLISFQLIHSSLYRITVCCFESLFLLHGKGLVCFDLWIFSSVSDSDKLLSSSSAIFLYCKVDLAPTFGFNPFRLTSRRLGRRGHVGEGTSTFLDSCFLVP
jgi:hypothetical protein